MARGRGFSSRELTQSGGRRGLSGRDVPCHEPLGRHGQVACRSAWGRGPAPSSRVKDDRLIRLRKSLRHHSAWPLAS